MEEFIYRCNTGSSTVFTWDREKGPALQKLLGVPCENISNGGWVKDMLSLIADRNAVVFDRTGSCGVEPHENGLTVSGIHENAGIRFCSTWTFCDKTGIWSRKDSVKNISDQKVSISRCLSRFSFLPGHYKAYSQSSRWCHESEGGWQALSKGGLLLSCEAGRTTQGFAPYVCIKEQSSEEGLVFHIIPNGNWVMKLLTKTAPGDTVPYLMMELGLSDDQLDLCLKPGETVFLPEILIQELIDGRPEKSASHLHQYLLANRFKNRPDRIPVVYNTWFDAFDDLHPERLERQLAAAKEIGCEVFTVDAGWYGAQSGDWFKQAGDWREKQDGAFRGRMIDFSKKVRSEGLGFGLWMEPERWGPEVPIVGLHPEWFIDAKNGYFYPDFRIEGAYEYIKGEMIRLIETYRLEWIKLDFNFDLGIDPARSEFTEYYRHWYRLIDEIKTAFPGLFIEGCASGGMRLELSSMSHCDAHFLTDTVFPTAVLHIYEGSLLRLAPGHLTKWAVMRSAGAKIPSYGSALEESPETLLTPCGATWERCQSANLDFIVFSAMPGVLGLGGDLTGLSGAQKKRLRSLVDFYKKYRHLLYDSKIEILTPLRTEEDNQGWHLLQAMSSGKDALLFAYRLDDSQKKYSVKLSNLTDAATYRVAYWDGSILYESIDGKSLMENGMTVEISERYQATAILISVCE